MPLSHRKADRRFTIIWRNKTHEINMGLISFNRKLDVNNWELLLQRLAWLKKTLVIQFLNIFHTLTGGIGEITRMTTRTLLERT